MRNGCGGKDSQSVCHSARGGCYYRVGHHASSIRGTEGKCKTAPLNGGSDCYIGRVVDEFDDRCGKMGIGLMIPRKLEVVDTNFATSA